jgi:hypothetical protein
MIPAKRLRSKQGGGFRKPTYNRQDAGNAKAEVESGNDKGQSKWERENG